MSTQTTGSSAAYLTAIKKGLTDKPNRIQTETMGLINFTVDIVFCLYINVHSAII